MHRSAIGMFPPKGWSKLVERSLGAVAPTGMTRVQTMSCGSAANENAFKVAFIAAASKGRVKEGRGADDFSSEDRSSCMEGMQPGSPDRTILSFEGEGSGKDALLRNPTRIHSRHTNPPQCTRVSVTHAHACLHACARICHTFAHRTLPFLLFQPRSSSKHRILYSHSTQHSRRYSVSV